MNYATQLIESLLKLTNKIPSVDEVLADNENKLKSFVENLPIDLDPFKLEVLKIFAKFNDFILDSSINDLNFHTQWSLHKITFHKSKAIVSKAYDELLASIDNSNLDEKFELYKLVNDVKTNYIEKRLELVVHFIDSLTEITKILEHKYSNKTIIDKYYTLELMNSIEKFSEESKFDLVLYLTKVNIYTFWSDHNLFIPTKNIQHILEIKNCLDITLGFIKNIKGFDDKEIETYQSIVLKFNALLKKQLEEYIYKKNGQLEQSRNFAVYIDNQLKVLSEYIPKIEIELVSGNQTSPDNNINTLKKDIDELKSQGFYRSIYDKIGIIKNLSENVNRDSFQKYCFNLFHCYTSLNGFSALIKSDNSIIDLVTVERRLQESIAILEGYGIRNYYPYRKAIKYYIQHVLTNSLSKNEFTLHYEKVTSYIEKFQEDIEWCRYFGFVTSLSDPHSNSYEIKYTDKNNIHYSQKICLVSGETDPIDYNYENKLLERYKIEILQLKQKHEFEYQLEKLKHKYDEFNSKTTDITTSFERKLENSKKAITSTMDKLKDSEKNSVQILGIFSAIALFTTGSISFFKDNILSASEAVAFILGYGFVLALFIIVLHFVFYYRYDKEKQHQKMHHKLIKYLVIGIVIIALFLVVHSKPILTWLNLTN